ncbi:hypothetical protein [Mycobacteroides abscessus]|uniref:hypothetical protein n=1 Tax=Mycobacteroides abscessus TaxID=36809 RepID=UPI0009269E8C|nr:hypothetical protein [Mycobacteroides abscessus]SIN33587.1 Uncharacterised protein [Mycobacteroides abscessus subsp. abscessus]
MTDPTRTDPAVEAARRADYIAQRGELGIYLNYKSPITREHASAREALRPIRKWHQKQSRWLSGKCSAEALMLKAQLADLAPLIYPTEELER